MIIVQLYSKLSSIPIVYNTRIALNGLSGGGGTRVVYFMNISGLLII